MAYIPKRGDIIHLDWNPASGVEMQGKHYALVTSPHSFNKLSGLAWVCPISQGPAELARNKGFIVTLIGSGTRTQGAIHCHQLKSLDWKQRKAAYQETVPDFIMEEVTARLLAFIEPDG
jgi:mRNA interferase ChpB